MTLYGGYEQGENSARGSLTVTARVSSGSSRHAMPSIPELVYAALLYTDDNKNENFAQAETADGGKLKFSFQRPKETSDLILEIFAFVKTDVVAEDGTTSFSRNSAPFSKAKKGLAIVGDAINVSETIVLEVNDSPDLTGTVSLEIKVPDGCSLTIDDIANFHCEKDEASSDTYVLTQKGTSGIFAGAYQVQFTVKKGTEIVYIFSEYINVINGLCTDTWNGLAKDEAKDIANSISKTVYVRGTGGWYETSPYNATANDANSGSFLAPFATIQKAVDTIIARKIADLESNDGEPVEPYTICVDGTLVGTTAERLGTYGMADFSKLEKNLTLTIKALSGTATLDAKQKSRVIYAKPDDTNLALNLTLENLILTGGGGIYNEGATIEIKGGEFSDCMVGRTGGGIYNVSGKLTVSACEFLTCKAISNSGGGVCNSTGATAIITNCSFTSCAAGLQGGGIRNAGILTVSNVTYSGCTSGNGNTDLYNVGTLL